eukprot:103312-Pyramimonas_sp.AAC.2
MTEDPNRQAALFSANQGDSSSVADPAGSVPAIAALCSRTEHDASDASRALGNVGRAGLQT